MEQEPLSKTATSILLVLIGVILVFVRWILVLLPLSFLVEAALYCLVGYIVGNHVYHRDWRWGILLALPAVLTIIYFFMTTGAATTSGVWVKNAVSFLAMPLSAALGIWLKVKKTGHHSILG